MSIFDRLETGKRFTLELPQDSISEEGIRAINKYLSQVYPERYQELRGNLGDFEVWLNRDWPRDWIVGKGPYAGTFPKRVSNWLFKERNIKTSADVVSQIGNLFSQHSNKHGTFYFDFTRRFRWRAGDFGDGGSCYWGGNGAARNMLEHYNCLAIRFYTSTTSDRGIGRAWIARLVSQSDVVTESRAKRPPRDEVLLLFNGYGEYETIRIARILATFLGVSYKAVGIENGGRANGTLWINHYKDGIHGGGRGFMLGAPEHIEPVTQVDLNYTRYDGDDDGDDDHFAHYCFICEEGLTADEAMRGPDGNQYCSNHWGNYFFECEHCGQPRSTDLNVAVRQVDGTESNWCHSCAHLDATHCGDCDEWVVDQLVAFADNGTPGCAICIRETA